MTVPLFRMPTPETAPGGVRFLRQVGPAHAPTRRIAVLVGTFPPRQCGIATFTADMQRSLSQAPGWICQVIAMLGENDCASPQAMAAIRHADLPDYRRAAQAINRSAAQVVSLQHEFGIFGGPSGAHILEFLEALEIPCVATLHTVTDAPTQDQTAVMEGLLRLCARVVVMSARGKAILVATYGADPDRIDVCPHGAPDVELVATGAAKARLGLAGRKVLLTFGLLSPAKGIETMIRALPALAVRNPDLVYVVLGATHPNLLLSGGDAYRDQLKALAAQLGVERHLLFVNCFVAQKTLLEYLAAADIYVTPYLNEKQITSGTLAYACALGKPIVSTRYWHAADLVDRTTGALVDFGDADGFAREISGLLADPERMQLCARTAWRKARSTTWAQAALTYARSYRTAIEAGQPSAIRWDPARPRLTAIARATGPDGIAQHTTYGVIDRAHGVCLDDNARLLLVIQRCRAAGMNDGLADRLEQVAAAFLQYAWNPGAGRFRNFMGDDRRWLESIGSPDSNGRAYWSLGVTALHCRDRDIADWARQLARLAAPHLATLRSTRAMAFCILGADALLEGHPGESEAAKILWTCAVQLQQRRSLHGGPRWLWYEPSLSYDNARLPEAMLRAGVRLDSPAMTRSALEALSWLTGLHRTTGGWFRPVGSATGNAPRERPAAFDQQPIEAAAAVDACAYAFSVTGDPAWRAAAREAHGWFFGQNDHGLTLATPGGGCRDGLTRDGLSRNQGAESLLAIQMANLTMAMLDRVNPPRPAIQI